MVADDKSASSEAGIPADAVQQSMDRNHRTPCLSAQAFALAMATRIAIPSACPSASIALAIRIALARISGGSCRIAGG